MDFSANVILHSGVLKIVILAVVVLPRSGAGEAQYLTNSMAMTHITILKTSQFWQHSRAGTSCSTLAEGKLIIFSC